MAQAEQQPNTDAQPQDARPEDPDKKTTERRRAGGGARQHHRPGTGTTTFGKNTRPRGNGDRDERDTERGREKLYSVLGQ